MLIDETLINVKCDGLNAVFKGKLGRKKMKEIRIKISNDMAKHEEILILEKLHEAFKGTQNYLENLFTVKMVTWASEEIRNDFSCDLHECLREANNETEDLRKQLYSVEQERDDLLKKLDILAKEKIGFMDKVIELENKNYGLKSENFELRTEVANTERFKTAMKFFLNI